MSRQQTCVSVGPRMALSHSQPSISSTPPPASNMQGVRPAAGARPVHSADHSSHSARVQSWAGAESSRLSLPHFYHPDITDMRQVFEVMQPYVGIDGAFLLRNSFSKPGVLTLTVIHQQGIKHFNISQMSGCYTVQDQQFRSMDELVRYYRHHDIPNIESVHGVRLLVAIESSRWTTPVRTVSLDSCDATESTAPHFGESAARSGISQMPNVAGDGRTRSSSAACADDAKRGQSSGHQLLARNLSDGAVMRDSSSDDALSERRQTVRQKLRHMFERTVPTKLLTHKTSKTSVQIPSPDVNPQTFQAADNHTVPYANHSIMQSREYRAINLQNSASESQDISTDQSNPVACSVLLPANHHSRRQPPIPTSDTASSLQTDQPSSSLANYSTCSVVTSPDRLYYSSPRDIDRGMAPELITMLRAGERDAGDRGNRCECGLDAAESELPRGWTLHISTEPQTCGRPFFTSPDGSTAWNLPLEVSIDLEPDQQDRIRNLLLSQRRFARASRDQHHLANMRNGEDGDVEADQSNISHEQDGLGAIGVSIQYQQTSSPDGNTDEHVQHETPGNTDGRCDDVAVTRQSEAPTSSDRARTRVQKQNRLTSSSSANSTSTPYSVLHVESADSDAEHRTSAVFDSSSSTQCNSCASDSRILCHITSETHV